MKSRFFAALALLASLCVYVQPSRAQSVEPPPDGSFPIPHVGPLTGGCQYFWTGIDVTTGNLYTCSGSLPGIGPNWGTWTLVGGSGGSGTKGEFAVFPSTGTTISSSTMVIDASQFSGVDPTGATDSYTGLQNAINAAIAANAELFIPAGSYKVSAGLVANNNYFRIRGAASYGNTKITASASGYTVFTIGAGSGQGGPQGYIKDVTIDGAGRPGSSDGFAALLISGMQEFEVTNVSLGGADICLDYSNNSFGGYINNVRGGFGGTCNVGFNIRKAAGAGGDFTIVNMWMDGVIAGMQMGGNTGGYHFFGGQINAGQGTSSPADSSGAVILGKDYLTGTTAEATVDFHGTSFEGTDYAWLFRTFWQSNLTCIACNLNPADGSHPAIGVYKGTNFLGGRVHLENCTISGFFSAASLASVAGVNGGLDGSYWTELNTYTAAQEPTVNGTGTYITSIAEQAGIANIATIIKSSTGLRVPDGFQEQPALAIYEPTCNSTTEGTYWAFTDATVSAPGSTISGGGGNHVLGYCNGTNYVVGGTGAPNPAPPIPTNWVLVNTAKTDAGASGVSSLAAPAASHTAGNLLVACVESFLSGTPTAATTPTNTAGDTWTLATSSRAQSSGGGDTECWWTVTAGNASDVVTAHWGTSITYPGIAVLQYSGNNPSGSFDFGNNANCTSVSTCSVTASTPALGDLIIAVVNNPGGGAGTYTAQSGYLFQGFTGTNKALLIEVQPGALNVSQTPGFANAVSSNYLVSVAAFKTGSFSIN
jgi:hypothetical protein